MLANYPSLTIDAVRQILRASADDLGAPGFDPLTGAGRLNIASALTIQSVPQVRIASPAHNADVLRQTVAVPITGTAEGSDFKEYVIASH
jgi:hypothetical protein